MRPKRRWPRYEEISELLSSAFKTAFPFYSHSFQCHANEISFYFTMRLLVEDLLRLDVSSVCFTVASYETRLCGRSAEWKMVFSGENIIRKERFRSWFDHCVSGGNTTWWQKHDLLPLSRYRDPFWISILYSWSASWSRWHTHHFRHRVSTAFWIERPIQPMKLQFIYPIDSPIRFVITKNQR